MEGAVADTAISEPSTAIGFSKAQQLGKRKGVVVKPLKLNQVPKKKVPVVRVPKPPREKKAPRVPSDTFYTLRIPAGRLLFTTKLETALDWQKKWRGEVCSFDWVNGTEIAVKGAA